MGFFVSCTEPPDSMPGISVTRVIYGCDHKVSNHICILNVTRNLIKIPKKKKNIKIVSYNFKCFYQWSFTLVDCKLVLTPKVTSNLMT